MFAAEKENETMIYFETGWVVIIIILFITIKERRTRKKAEWPEMTDDESQRKRDEEIEKFHKWWNENMADKYGNYDKNCGDDNSEP